MSYEKQDFKDGQTLNAEHLNHIEDGIDQLFNSKIDKQEGYSLVSDNEKTKWNEKSDFSGDYNDLLNKPTIPTNTSDLNNDSNFLTQHQSLDGYAKKTDIPKVPTKTSQLENDSNFLTQHQDLSGKQDKLMSGENIKTINGTSLLGSGDIEIQGGSETTQENELELLVDYVVTAEDEGAISITFTEENYPNISNLTTLVMGVYDETGTTSNSKWYGVWCGNANAIMTPDSDPLEGAIAVRKNGYWLFGYTSVKNLNNAIDVSPKYSFYSKANKISNMPAFKNYKWEEFDKITLKSYASGFFVEGTKIKIWGCK